MKRILILIGMLLFAVTAAYAADKIKVYSVEKGGYIESEKVVKSVEEWRSLLTPEQFHILREKGTERAFTHPLHDHKGEGVYRCAGCNPPTVTNSPALWLTMVSDALGTFDALADA